MFKHMMLGGTMLAAIAVGAFGMSTTATAHDCDYGYGYGGYGYRAAYYPVAVSYYAPQVVYPGSYAAFHPVYIDTHHHHGHHHHHHHDGVTFSVGF
jgi:hypothetical protein